MSTKGYYTLYYKQTDAAGNEGTASTTVVVKDMIIPTFTGNTEDVNIEWATTGEVWATNITLPTVNPGYIGEAILYDVNNVVKGVIHYNNAGVVTESISGQIDRSTVTTYKIKYTAVSGFGNTTEFTRTIVVQDTTAPDIQFESGNETLQIERGTSTINYEFGVTVDGYTPELWTDMYGDDSFRFFTSIGYDDLNVHQEGTYYITYVALDGVGNVSSKARTIKVVQESNQDGDYGYGGNVTEPLQGAAVRISGSQTWAAMGGNSTAPRTG